MTTSNAATKLPLASTPGATIWPFQIAGVESGMNPTVADQSFRPSLCRSAVSLPDASLTKIRPPETSGVSYTLPEKVACRRTEIRPTFPGLSVFSSGSYPERVAA